MAEIPDGCPDMFEVFANRCPRIQSIDVRRWRFATHSNNSPSKSFGFSFSLKQLSYIRHLMLGGKLSESFVTSLFYNPDDLEVFTSITSLRVDSSATCTVLRPAGLVSALAPRFLNVYNADPALVRTLVSTNHLAAVSFRDTSNAAMSLVLRHLAIEHTIHLGIDYLHPFTEEDDDEDEDDEGDNIDERYAVRAFRGGSNIPVFELGCGPKTARYIFSTWKMTQLDVLHFHQYGTETKPLHFAEGFRNLVRSTPTKQPVH